MFATFDNVGLRDLRLAEEAASFGSVEVLLPSDACIEATTGRRPTFPLEERRYFAEAVRWVNRVHITSDPRPTEALIHLPDRGHRTWVTSEGDASDADLSHCLERGVAYEVVQEEDLQLPGRAVDDEASPPRPTVVVSGCYDWLHSGHIRFFEEVASLGNLYVTIGNDDSVRAFKGEGHPLFTAEVRRFMVASMRHVHTALIASGSGWLDAAAEIERLEPDILAVNEDGDRPEKRAYCADRGIEYRVLARLPKAGLPRRSSTELRGF